jgi:hypothetical protein
MVAREALRHAKVELHSRPGYESLCVDLNPSWCCCLAPRTDKHGRYVSLRFALRKAEDITALPTLSIATRCSEVFTSTTTFFCFFCLYHGQ